LYTANPEGRPAAELVELVALDVVVMTAVELEATGVSTLLDTTAAGVDETTAGVEMALLDEATTAGELITTGILLETAV
jgi:hypothetical protein